MQPSSSMRATIVSAENQNGATIVKATFFFCHYYIVWESNNAGEARGQSWNESLKCRCIPGGWCGYTSGTKRKHFAALSSPRPCWRWLQLQPSCGSPQCLGHGWVITSHRILWDIINSPCPRYLLLASKSICGKLKYKISHDANFVVIGDNGGWYHENSRIPDMFSTRLPKLLYQKKNQIYDTLS